MITLKRLTIVFIIITISLTMLFRTPSTEALGLGSITKIISIIKTIVKYINLAKNIQSSTNTNIFPFGGRITHSEGGCALKFRIWTWIQVPTPVGPIPVPIPCPSCGLIPLGGNTIEVGPPGVPSPKGQIFTFPYITEIYNNNNEEKVGPWTLGLGFRPFPIDKINDALKEITISIPPSNSCPGAPRNFYIPSCFDDFHLKCSDNDKNVILKIGTS